MDYTKKTIGHFRHPHNFGHIKKPDGIGEVGNLVCGDLMKIYIEVSQNKKKEDIISDIKFETYGCIAAVATSSVLTDLAKGKTLKQALKIKSQDIVKSLGGMPQIKLHCSVLAQDALAEAIYGFYISSNKSMPKGLKDRHNLIVERQKKLQI